MLRKHLRLRRSVAIFAIAGILPLAASTMASAADPFFKGKQITLLIGGTAGGGLDTAARIFSRHLARHVPGNPVITPQLMPGAGGIRVLDYLAGVAPKDGTTIATIPSGPLLEPLIGSRKISYQMTDFASIGAWTKDVSMCLAWHSSGFKTLEDAKQREMTVAGTGAGSTTDIYPVVINAVLGTKFKVITGYRGTRETAIAMERGETHGRCGWTWSSLRGVKADWIRDNKIVYLMQMGTEKHPDFPDLPSAIDLAKTTADKQMLKLLFAPLALSNAYLGPPGLPADRLAELRKAFNDTMADKAVVDETIKIMKGPARPTNGAQMQQLMSEMFATPKPVIDRLRQILKR